MPDDVAPAVVGRRGGVVLRERGRWFVYTEMRRGRKVVESWLPVENGDARQRASDTARYAYIPPTVLD